MRPRILIAAAPERIAPRALGLLRAEADVDVRGLAVEEQAEALCRYDAVWVLLGQRLAAGALAGAERCRIIATPTTGLDHIDLAACAARGIEVVSLRGEIDFLRDVRATAELTIALALALLRRIPDAVAAVRRGEWRRDDFAGGELHGKTAGLVGVGRLGGLVAGYLRGFGVRVLGFDPRPDFPAALAERVDALPDLLSRSDLISLHVAYDATTRHLIGRAELAAIPTGALLVNTSRGGVIDEAALLDALASGRLAGAALDVLDGEPDIDGDHPLVAYARAHDNLIITPHIGGYTRESREKTDVHLAGRLLAALRREP